MKICLIGPGIMPIPPTGWGGVEHLIWNYSKQLEKDNHEVFIINTQNLNEIVSTINSQDFDVVHLHYDHYANIMPHIKCKKKLITSHYPYLQNPEPQYLFLYDLLKNSESHIVCLSDQIKDECVKRGMAKDDMSVVPCGIDTELYAIDETDVVFSNKSIIVGKIEPRKRQAFLQNKDLNIDFIGNNVDSNFDESDIHWLGEQDKQDIMDNLTAYANMILLSCGEAHPFVCLEGMAAGLGLVLSEQSTANLDISQPFITVIPDNKINDIAYLKEKIEENRKISLNMRKKIRQYCFDNFDWSVIIDKYLLTIEKLN
jgi:glycosyltransferase involved in cell wall biosynthesis